MEKINFNMSKNDSIKTRLIRYFMAVIIIGILTFSLLTVIFIRQYYYNNIQQLLENQVSMSAEFYEKYFSNATLEENLMSNVDMFWNDNDAQVQIIDKNGKVIMDSIGAPASNEIKDDVRKAISGYKGVWIGSESYSDSKVMAISYPLKRYGNIEGALRFITSLKEVDKEISIITIIFMAIALFIIIISIIAIVIVADSIINPIKELIKSAQKMADGDFKAVSKKIRNDEVGKLSDTLNYMALEIMKKDEMKNDFISNVSHELRTPLTSIKGWAVTLKYEGIDKATMDNGLSIIENESDRLSEMVEELLSFSKLVSGKIEIKKSWTDIHDITNYLKLYMGMRAERDGINFIIDEEKDLPKIYVDENRIKQILINLIDNSFKFTDIGGEVTLKAESDGTSMILSVIDTGCGISDEDLPHVKEKFYKGKSSKSQNGIGLSICDTLVKMHGGTIDIESSQGKGTKVVVIIPIREQ